MHRRDVGTGSPSPPSDCTSSTCTDDVYVQPVQSEGLEEHPDAPSSEGERPRKPSVPPLPRRDDPIGLPADGLSTRPDDSGYGYVLLRMRRSWRKADRRFDSTGRPADLTIGSTRTRRNWSEVLHRVIAEGAIIRIRHRYVEEPALLVPENVFRDIEARAEGRGGKGG